MEASRWPDLQGQELAHLQVHFSTPAQLEAAFDTEEEAESLIRLLLPGIADQGAKQRVQVLLDWSKKLARPLKVQRREAVARSFELLPSSVVEDPKLVESFDELANQNPLTLLAAIDRRRKASRTDLDPAKRAELERTAREKYTALLSDVIVRAKLPLVAQLSGLQDEASAWKRIFGTRRSKTLRNRYKCWSGGHLRNGWRFRMGDPGRIMWGSSLIMLKNVSTRAVARQCLRVSKRVSPFWRPQGVSETRTCFQRIRPG